MSRIVYLVMALCVAFCLFTHAHASDLRRDVVKAAQLAQDAIQAQRPAQAVPVLKSALGLSDLKDPETFLLNRLLAVAALQSQDAELSVQAINSLLDNPLLPAAERPKYLSTLVSAAIRAKDPVSMESAARQCLELKCPADSMRLNYMQALYLQGKHNDLISFARSEAGQTPSVAAFSEEELRVIAASQMELKDKDGYLRTLLLLLEKNPGTAYWSDVLLRLTSQNGFDPRLELDVYRLMRLTGTLLEDSEYSEMARLAVKAGLPIEALSVLEEAKSKGILQDVESQKLMEQVRKRAKEDEVLLNAPALPNMSGQAWAQQAMLLFSAGRWQDASNAFAEAVKLGGIKRVDEVRLHQGIALAQAGKKSEALQVFAQVDGGAAQLARLWVIYLRP